MSAAIQPIPWTPILVSRVFARNGDLGAMQTQGYGHCMDDKKSTATQPQSPPATEATPFDDGALYDVVLEKLEYGLDFYLQLARAAGGPVLDVGCGTGRIMLPCLQAGLDVDGLD